MTEAELDALLDGVESEVNDAVAGLLSEVAAGFVRDVNNATELVAARFSVSGIRRRWQRRVGRLVTMLTGVMRTAAQTTAEDLGERLPRNWDAGMRDYQVATTALLNAVGDRLAADATQALAEGLNAGEDIDQLKERLTALFTADPDGTELGSGRANRIAMTEATRAWNAGALAAAQALTGPQRPLVKQWLSRNDTRVRAAHEKANGQLRFLDEPFSVGGSEMQYPGDPTAPADLTIGCRCVMKMSAAQATASAEGTFTVDQELQSHMPPQLKRYWLAGPGAAKIGWGTPGSFDRCVSALRDDFPQDPEGLCANLYHEATGRWPGQNQSAGEVHPGAMIALIPSEADAQRLALDGGEPVDQLHLTLLFLGEGADWSADERALLVSRVAEVTRGMGPITARAFGAAQWNPDGDNPCWVWNVGDIRESDGTRLHRAYDMASDAVGDRPIPEQYVPWSPHICAQYTDLNLSDELANRTGPVTFDRVRVVFAGDSHDFALSHGTEAAATAVAEDVAGAPAPATAAWYTPEGAALAFENQQTGDGRLFAPGVLRWESGPWPLQYAEEMNGGHNGARLAGSIRGMSREGGRITGHGDLYLTLDAGREAAGLLAQGAPLGVSVDLDDVDMEMSEVGGEGAYAVSLATASLLPMPGGGWSVTAETAVHWTASGTRLSGESRRLVFAIDPDGTVPASVLTAAAGDPDPGGLVVEKMTSGEYLMRITRGRIRGATLVAIPAFADARIALVGQPDAVAATTPVVDDVADITAAATGAVDLPVAGRDVSWDGDGAKDRVFTWADGDVDRLSQAFAYRDSDADPQLKGSWKLGYADVLDGVLTIVPKGVFAAEAAVNGARGGVDIPAEEMASVRAKLDAVRAHVEEVTASVDDRETMEASAWSAMKDLPPMPASWFAQPTHEELPPGGPGVNYKEGRIFGWVAQAGEPHAGFAKKITIDSLGRIDTTHFLRQRFQLDDGTTVKAGALVMNTGHHRDGAECETASCAFDDSRTVAGVVTVGMTDRGMWFSGASGPWISEWDRQVFSALQPSYHLIKRNGGWQLRGVLMVPVPGHSSPLLASAVAERSQLALTAAATMAEVETAVAAAQVQEAPTVAPVVDIDYEKLADAMVASMARAEQRKAEEAAELQALIEEARRMDPTTNEGM